MTRVLLLPVLALMLGSCNYLAGEDGIFRDRTEGYEEARVLPELNIPPELDSYTLDPLYVIPEQASSNTEPFEEIPPPKPIEERRREGVIIQRLTDTSWILIDATPGQVWPMVRDYWTELQIQLEYENPGNGLMETAWLEIGGDQELRHKYRIAIEPGLHSGYSEIYVTHISQERDSPIPTVVSWPEESDNPELEQDIMRSVSQYLADRNDIYQASSASLLAGSIEAASKANIVRNDAGEQVLELKIDFDRAWVQVREALEEAEVEILDINRDQAVYNVRFAGLSAEADERGFIGRVFNRRGNDEPVQPRDFSIRLLDTGDSINVVTEPMESSEDAEQLTADLLQAINDNIG